MPSKALVESVISALEKALTTDGGPLFVRVRRRDLGDAIRVMRTVIDDCGDPAVESRLHRAISIITEAGE